MQFDTYTYTIAQHWACALVNNDWSGLADDECAQLQDFIASLPGPGHWDFSDEESHFARDDVSGLFADCIDAIYLVRSI